MEAVIMTREETQNLLAMIQATYPNFNPPDKTAAVNAWRMALSDCQWDDVQRAFAVYMRTNSSGFAPSPGQIMEKIMLLTSPQEMNELEAWTLVSKALRNSTYNSVEEFQKLPVSIQKAIGRPEQLRIWAMDETFNESVASSNFMRSYRVVMDRRKELNKLPEKIRILVENLNQNALAGRLETSDTKLIENTREEEEQKNKASGRLHGIPDNAIEKLKAFGLR